MSMSMSMSIASPVPVRGVVVVIVVVAVMFSILYGVLNRLECGTFFSFYEPASKVEGQSQSMLTFNV